MTKNRPIIVVACFAVLAVGLLFTGCKDKTEPNSEAEVTPTPAISATPVPVDLPEESESNQANLEGQVYTNEQYSYKITLPTGYTVEVKSAAQGASGLGDQATILDEQGNQFAVIYTPPLETGFELWEAVNSKLISVSGSSVTLDWIEAWPKETSGEERGVVTVGWGIDAESDFTKAGLMIHSFDTNNSASVQEFEEIVRTLRFTDGR